MGCIAPNSHQSDILLAHNGKIIQIDPSGTSFQRLLRTAQGLAKYQDPILMSIGTSGNAFRIDNQLNWASLRISKKSDLTILVIAPADLQDSFKVVQSNKKKINRQYFIIQQNYKMLMQHSETFDDDLASFVQAMSYFYIRNVSLQSILMILVMLLSPYMSKIVEVPPYFLVQASKRKEMTQSFLDLYTKWQIVTANLMVIEQDVQTLLHNLTYVYSYNNKNQTVVNHGKNLDVFALIQAENKLKLFKALQEVKRISSGLQKFKSVISEVGEAFQSNQTIQRVSLMAQRAMASGVKEVSWLFSMNDYSLKTGEFRFQ